MNEKINFWNEVILIYDDYSIVQDEWGNLYFVDNGGNKSAYPLGDTVASEDLTLLDELPKNIAEAILEALGNEEV